MRTCCIPSSITALVICVFFGLGRASPAAERLTYIDLVGRLTDLEYLATLPADGEKCAQWSRYDRRSKYDSASVKYIDWAANVVVGAYEFYMFARHNKDTALAEKAILLLDHVLKDGRVEIKLAKGQVVNEDQRRW